MARRLAGQLACPALGGSCFRSRSLRQAPRFFRIRVSRRVARGPSSRGRGHEKPLRSFALGRGPKVGTGQPSVRRPLREQRARRRLAWCQGQMRSVDFPIFRTCVASFFPLRASCPAQGTRLLRFSIRRVKHGRAIFSRVRHEVPAGWLSVPLRQSSLASCRRRRRICRQ